MAAIDDFLAATTPHPQPHPQPELEPEAELSSTLPASLAYHERKQQARSHRSGTTASVLAQYGPGDTPQTLASFADDTPRRDLFTRLATTRPKRPSSSNPKAQPKPKPRPRSSSRVRPATAPRRPPQRRRPERPRSDVAYIHARDRALAMVEKMQHLHRRTTATLHFYKPAALVPTRPATAGVRRQPPTPARELHPPASASHSESTLSLPASLAGDSPPPPYSRTLDQVQHQRVIEAWLLGVPNDRMAYSSPALVRLAPFFANCNQSLLTFDFFTTSTAR